MKAAEEMSPRHLNRLQRLLSKTEEYSPRNHLGPRWREYHGSNDWKGLLDPLDENLRREVVRYGEFVQASYHAFHSNPAMSAQVALPDRSYRVTKSLYATSSVGLPKWVDDVAPDLGWMTQRSSWIGYVAVCEDRREIQRLGRRDIVIALRGTSTCLEWAENMRAQLVETPGEHDPTEIQPKVECGFLSLYKTAGANVPSLSQSVVQEVTRLMELYSGEALSITVTGHSLGAALALLVGDELSTCAPHVPPVAVFSFGGPRVGNKGFANQINSKNVKVLRIVNSQDVITRVPGIPIVEQLNDNMPLAYAHVGTELRVDTKMSPYLKPNADVACCHDLEAYLHLVDGFIASNCPFRANAKRSLVRLLNEQGSNVKRLYTSKAQALSLSFERKGLAASGCLPSPS
ncbi:phospholipase A1-Ibeta2 [Populus alba x Populus x berolinensis]|nr:phospholipase A1-Ibeta2 [Populus alba x Populus x berolinensis]